MCVGVLYVLSVVLGLYCPAPPVQLLSRCIGKSVALTVGTQRSLSNYYAWDTTGNGVVDQGDILVKLSQLGLLSDSGARTHGAVLPPQV